MTAWASRLELARDGWATECRITEVGLGRERAGTHRAVGVWARTWFWSGWITEVCLHAHAIAPLAEAGIEASIDAVVADVLEACRRARAEFRDSIPCLGQGRDREGRLKLAENSWAMGLVRDTVRRPHPLERIPGADTSAPDVPLSRLLARTAAEQGPFGHLHVEDRLSGTYGPPQLLRDMTSRSWGYEVALAPRSWAGRPLRFKPFRRDGPDLGEKEAGQHIRETRAALDALFGLSSPGASALPEGYAWRDEGGIETGVGLPAPSP